VEKREPFSFGPAVMKNATTIKLTLEEKDVLVDLLDTMIAALDAHDPYAIELTRIKQQLTGTLPDIALAA
jgi:hypothetical protein